MIVRALLVGMLLVSLVVLGASSARVQAMGVRHHTASSPARTARLAAVAQHDALIRELQREYGELQGRIAVLPTAPDDAVERALTQRHALLVQRAHLELVVPPTPGTP